MKKQAMDAEVQEEEERVMPEVYEFQNPKHAQEVLGTFDHLRKKGLFTDVILSTSNREFPCHRAVLVSGKPNERWEDVILGVYFMRTYGSYLQF